MPIFSASARVAAYVASLVCAPRMISTSCITGTGFMKCMPMTRSGRSTLAAMRVMGIEEVLVARIASGRSERARSWKTFFFTDSFSVTASTANSAWDASWAADAPLTRASVARDSSALSLPLLTARSSWARIPARPFCTRSGSTSRSTTESPLWAATCAMPAPICPAPTTASVFTSTVLGSRVKDRGV